MEAVVQTITDDNNDEQIGPYNGAAQRIKARPSAIYISWTELNFKAVWRQLANVDQ